MILLTNGCSWTDRTYFRDQNDTRYNTTENLVWPEFLAEKLSATQLFNISQGGGSNGRIVRTCFDWIINQTQETLADTVAVIQWTDPSRWEWFDPNNSYNNGWRPIMINKSSIEQQEQNVFAFYTDLQAMYKHIFEIEALDSLFKKSGIKAFYWSLGHTNYPWPDGRYLEKFLSYSWLDDPKNEKFWNYERISEQDHHPSPVGHDTIAQLIYNQIKDQV